MYMEQHFSWTLQLWTCPNCRMYLSIYNNMYLSKLPNVFVQIALCCIAPLSALPAFFNCGLASSSSSLLLLLLLLLLTSMNNKTRIKWCPNEQQGKSPEVLQPRTHINKHIIPISWGTHLNEHTRKTQKAPRRMLWFEYNTMFDRKLHCCCLIILSD